MTFCLVDSYYLPLNDSVMLNKINNVIYFCALFLGLLYVSIPVLPVIIHITAISLFFIYLVISKVDVNTVYKKWTLAYISFFLLSSLWALKAKLSLYIVLVELSPIVLLSFATIAYVKKNRSINVILFVIYIVSLIMLGYLLTHIEEFLIGERLGVSLNEEGDDRVWNSNSIGVGLCFALFAGFILFVLQKKKPLIRAFYYITAFIMIVGVLLTGSRKSLLIMLMPFVYFIYKREKKHFLFFVLLASLIMFLFYEIIMNVEFFYETIGVRMEDMMAILSNDTTGDEDTSRIQLINLGIDNFFDNPILGVGANNFRVLSETIYPGRNFYAHNNYIELLVDVGIIGFLVYYSAYYYLFLNLKDSQDPLSLWAKLFLYILLFLGFVEVLYYEPLEQLIFATIFCVVDSNKTKINLLDGSKKQVY